MAEELNRQGSQLYKAGQLAEAEAKFAEAAALDSGEPKYSSNLSSALYEQGKYKSCIRAIADAWDKLRIRNASDHHGPPFSADLDGLAVKLASRLAKARMNDLVANASSLEPLPPCERPSVDNAKTHTSIELFSTERPSVGSFPDPKVNEMVTVWEAWTSLKDKVSPNSSHQAEISAAQARLRALKIYKFPSDPTLEHYNFGHDEIRSLLDSTDANHTGVSFNELSEEEKRCLSFLFGGSGDARHVFGTLIDFVDKFHTENANDIPRLHLTLLEIHPATVARTLVIFKLIELISLAENPIEELELEATLFYLYVSLAIPGYCEDIVMNISKSLESNLSTKLPRWLHVNNHDIEAVKDVLRYWSTPLQKSTRTLIELHTQHSSLNRGSILFGRFHKNIKNQFSDQEIRVDDAVYDCLKIFLPPEQLRSRHPALAMFANSYVTDAHLAVSKANREVRETWRPNPTLFDEHSTEHPAFSRTPGYPMVTMDPYQTIETMMLFNHRIQSDRHLAHGPIVFSAVSGFFRHVVDAVRKLGERLTIELVLEDVVSGLPKLISGDLGERPVNSPMRFTRMWLSNVPDYTNGILDTAVYILPHHTTPAGNQMTMSNCLLNTQAFRTIQDFCYNYTLLNQEDLPYFLGCSMKPSGPLAGKTLEIHPLPTPRPLEQLASKAQLHRWLSHILLCILCNGIPLSPPKRVDLPNNLNSFFGLLVYLSKVGFPSHWLGEFVQLMLSDRLVAVVKPYLGRLPIPPSEKLNIKAARRIHLDAWRAEFEVILATVGPALPFFVDIPKEYPTLGEICTYRAVVQSINLRRHPYFQYWAPLSSPFVKTVGLIFYEPNQDFGADELAHQISMILEGDPDISAIQKQIMLGADNIDLQKGEIQWKMSGMWFEKMKKEGWKIVAYRTDLTISVTEALGVDQCVEV